MGHSNWLGGGVLLAFIFLVASLAARTPLNPRLKKLICWGLLFRVAGATAFLGLVTTVYARDDYFHYFNLGLEYAQGIWSGDLSLFWDVNHWWGRKWWGTQFVIFASGIVLSMIGPSMLGAFLVFSLLGFLGLLGFAVAFHRSFPGVPLANYVRWIFLFPSLWFWPSTIGKEAVVLLGLGLCVAGYVGRRGRINWTWSLLGLLLVLAVRPPVAMVIVVSILIAEWVSWGERWTFAKTVQLVGILGVSSAGLWLTASQLGLEAFDPGDVSSYMEETASTAALGHSSISSGGAGWRGALLALPNTLFRPLPWDVRNVTGLLASLEIWAFWLIAVFRRRQLACALRKWRAQKMTRLALPFVLLYAVSFGMVVVNLGIIARQRIFLFPFLFVLLEAAPVAQNGNQRARQVRAGKPLQRPSEALVRASIGRGW